MDKLKLVTLALTLGLVSMLIVGVGAVYLMESNHLSHTSSDKVLIALTQNATISVAGVDTVRLTATEASLTGTTVSFFDGATLLGSSVSSGGVATYDFAVSVAKTWDFHATAQHP